MARSVDGRQLGIVTVLAGGVALYATNVYLTTSLLPSAVVEIGGERFYAWVTTVYLIASVSAATVVSPLLGWAGPRGAYLLAFGAFAVGTLVCAVAPGMHVLLAGRAVQGAAEDCWLGLLMPSSIWRCHRAYGLGHRHSPRRCGVSEPLSVPRPAVFSPNGGSGGGHSGCWRSSPWGLPRWCPTC